MKMAISMGCVKTACRNFVFHFAHENLEFRIPEVVSIASSFGINLEIPKTYDARNPYLSVSLPSEEAARQIMSRTVTIKSLIEVWACGDSYASLLSQLATFPQHLSKPFTSSDQSYRIRVECFNKQQSLDERISRIERVLEGPISFDGKLDLSDRNDNTFHLLEYYGPQGSPPPEEPCEVFFGRWLCSGQRDFINHYHLQKRRFIGNTSMDPTLALIMANMAKVSPGMLVCDPFVGTGSLLVACAHFGGHVLGTDIDYNLLIGVGKSSRAGQKWRSKEESVRNNLRQYGLERFYVDLLISDASRHQLWRRQEFLDAIVADPPYGVREPTVKLGSKKEITSIDEAYKEGHIPCKTTYGMSDIIADLLHFAAQFLTMNGRLVFWIPVNRHNYKETNIPQHPCLRLIANSEQTLNTRVSRRLITMEKVQRYQDGMRNGTIVIDDHYRDSSFRDQYFRPSSKPPKGSRGNRTPPSEATS